MRLVDMLPKHDGQVFVCGKKGSGKSSLVRQLLRKLGDNTIIIVIDSKHEWKVPRIGNRYLGNKRVHRLLFPDIRLVRSPGIYVYQSRWPHFYDPNVTRILLTAYTRQNVTIVIHELYHFCHGANALPALGQAIAQGRSKNLRLFLESQRPSNIDLRCETEADVYICARLSRKADRERMADVAEAPEMVNLVHGHDFWVITSTMENAILIHNEQDAKVWDSPLSRKPTITTKEKNLAPAMP